MRHRASGNHHPEQRALPATAVLENAAPEARSRVSALASIYDAGTIRRLTELGVGKGRHCLEVGAGTGSIAAWLCKRVGSGGRVVATDIDTRFLDGLTFPNLEIRRHDIVYDPMPDEQFDIVHARLLLVLLPDRERALARLVGALKPDGVILLEEPDSLSAQQACQKCPIGAPLRAYSVFQTIMAERGADTLYGRRLAERLRALGLSDVHAEGGMFLWHGASAGAELIRANLVQLREPIVGSGLISETEFEGDLARLDDPDFVFPSPMMWSVSARLRALQ